MVERHNVRNNDGGDADNQLTLSSQRAESNDEENPPPPPPSTTPAVAFSLPVSDEFFDEEQPKPLDSPSQGPKAEVAGISPASSTSPSSRLTMALSPTRRSLSTNTIGFTRSHSAPHGQLDEPESSSSSSKAEDGVAHVARKNSVSFSKSNEDEDQLNITIIESQKVQPKRGGVTRRYSSSFAQQGSTLTNASTDSAVNNITSGNSSNSAVPPSGRLRVFRSTASDKFCSRDIAALDFLLGIPMEAEQSIVHHGWQLQQQRRDHSDDEDDDDDDDRHSEEVKREMDDELLEPPSAIANTSHHGRWWEKWIAHPDMNANTVRANSSGTLAHNSSHRYGGTPQPSLSQQPPHPASAGHWQQQHPTDIGPPLALSPRNPQMDAGELESPTDHHHNQHPSTPDHNNYHAYDSGEASALGTGSRRADDIRVPVPAPIYAPGRRLEGDKSITVQIPLTVDTVTRQKSIARQAAIREWELRVAHGLDSTGHPPMLNGRMFFSAKSSYPVGVFSLVRYEPKREEAALRRQKLEARGGGGSHFVMPSRDWRGISYRALLPRKGEQRRNEKAFKRFLRRDIKDRRLRKKKAKAAAKRKKRALRSAAYDDSEVDRFDDSDDDSIDDSRRDKYDQELDDDDDSDFTDDSSVSSSSTEAYVPGLLDDPKMTLGRHRNVMIGDCVTGGIVASTIQFVEPALLKADLNKKFRERFDGWEPPKSLRKFIGAKVVDGVYTLFDPVEDTNDDLDNPSITSSKSGPGTTDNAQEEKSTKTTTTPAIIRMPPSLTLSKIRSAKRQALEAFVKAKLEVGTVALACVYFERLCLSCRVDKTNRRLCFASCLLLATKINEPNEVLVMKEETIPKGDTTDGTTKKIRKGLQSSIRPNKRSSFMFASLLEFFTQDWSLSLKHLFAAEWGVFAALRFSLHAKPSQVAFHYKRLMKSLDWKPLNYLGKDMYNQWQEALADEEKRRVESEKRKELRRVRKEERIQRELEKEIIRNKQLAEEALRNKQKKPSSKKDTARKPKSAVVVEKSQSSQDTAGPRTSTGGPKSSPMVSPMNNRGAGKKRPIKLFNRLTGMRRPSSTDKLNALDEPDEKSGPNGLPLSPSMPVLHSNSLQELSDNSSAKDSDGGDESVGAASDSALLI